MKYEMKTEDDRLVVSVEGELDVRTSPDFEKALLPELEKTNDVVFDMKDLVYCSSAGLRTLLAAAKVMAAKNGKMTLTNVSEDVMEILDVTGFSKLFVIE